MGGIAQGCGLTVLEVPNVSSRNCMYEILPLISFANSENGEVTSRPV